MRRASGEAAVLAERLSKEEWHHIYSSDLQRALVTAETVAARLAAAWRSSGCAAAGNGRRPPGRHDGSGAYSEVGSRLA